MNKEQDVPWWYNGKIIEGSEDPRVPLWAVGYVYKISRYANADRKQGADRNGLAFPDKIYIGKKQLKSNRKGKVSQKEIKATGTRKRVKMVIKDSNWMKYSSSCPEVVKDIKEHPELMRKEIITWCWSKKHLSYCEMEMQVKENVLRENTYNGNILSRFFKRDLIKPEAK